MHIQLLTNNTDRTLSPIILYKYSWVQERAVPLHKSAFPLPSPLTPAQICIPSSLFSQPDPRHPSSQFLQEALLNLQAGQLSLLYVPQNLHQETCNISKKGSVTRTSGIREVNKNQRWEVGKDEGDEEYVLWSMGEPSMTGQVRDSQVWDSMELRGCNNKTQKSVYSEPNQLHCFTYSYQVLPPQEASLILKTKKWMVDTVSPD